MARYIIFHLAEVMMRVMLIEDNKQDQDILKKILTPYADSLFITEDGEVALNHLKEVDLVILDLNLPLYLGGRDLLKIIKKKRKSLPVIIYSNSSNPEDIKYCYQNGAACYVTKPFGLIDTMEKLKSLGEFWKGVTYAYQGTGL